MSDKIVVPEDGLKAALYAAKSLVGRHVDLNELVTRAVEGFVLWLSENPIVPNKEDVKHITRVDKISLEDFISLQAFSTEWQRRMFLATEPVFDATLGGALLGRTFTREQANAIKNIIDMAVHG